MVNESPKIVSCPKCGVKLKVKSEVVKIACPKCKIMFLQPPAMPSMPPLPPRVAPSAAIAIAKSAHLDDQEMPGEMPPAKKQYKLRLVIFCSIGVVLVAGAVFGILFFRGADEAIPALPSPEKKPAHFINGDAIAKEGEPYTITLSSQSVAGDQPSAIEKWIVSWGDGQTETLPGDAKTASHVYKTGCAGYLISAKAIEGSDEIQAAFMGDKAKLAKFPRPQFFQDESFITSPWGTKLALQPDGKFVAVSSSFVKSKICRFVVSRFNPDASIDTSFGDNGRTFIDFGGKASFGKNIVVQPDGKIVVVGYVMEKEISDFAVARLDSGGKLDLSFGYGGKVTIDVADANDDQAFTVLLDDKNNILVGGSGKNTDTYSFAAVRLDSSGKLDSSFGKGGKTFVNTSSETELAYAMQIMPDGNILQGGFKAKDLQSQRSGLVVCLDSKGNLNKSFGENGAIVTEGLNMIMDIKPYFKKRFVVCGNNRGAINMTMCVGRYDLRGKPDNAFGNKGVVTLDRAEDVESKSGRQVSDYQGAGDTAYRCIVDSYGRIVLGGMCFDTNEARFRPIIRRLNPDGRIDSSFGQDGKTVLLISGADYYCYDVVPLLSGGFILPVTCKMLAVNNLNSMSFDGMPYQRQQTILFPINPNGSSAAHFVQVKGIDPVILVSGDREVNAGQEYKITIKVEKPASGFGGISRFVIDWGDGATSEIKVPNVSATHKYTVDNENASSCEYAIQAAAIVDGEGGYISHNHQVVEVTNLDPTSPGSVHTKQDKDGYISLEWRACDRAVNYEIYRCKMDVEKEVNGGKQDWALIATTKDAEYQDAEFLPDGQTYQYYVVAIGVNGVKSRPGGIGLETINARCPEMPTGISHEYVNGKFVLKWKTSKYAQGYTIFRNDEKIAEYHKDNSYTDLAVENGKEYTYTIEACNLNVTTRKSDAYKVTIQIPTSRPASK